MAEGGSAIGSCNTAACRLLSDQKTHGTRFDASDVLVLQRTQICYGSLGEVRRFEEFMLGKSERFADAAVKA